MIRNERNRKYREEKENEAKKFRIFGIIFICVSISNPVFLIFGIIFLSRSSQIYRELKKLSPTQYDLFEPQNSPNYEFNVNMTRFCPTCGIELESEDKFCFSCGTRQD